MTPARWQYLKQLQPSPGRMVHVSARAQMIDVPVDPKNPTGETMRVPWVQKPGVTFCENRSARKVANREYLARRFHYWFSERPFMGISA